MSSCGLFSAARGAIKISQVEQAARAAGLLRPNQALTQCRVLRDTRMAMGLMLTPEVSDTGEWVWAMPGACNRNSAGEAGAEFGRVDP